MKLEGLGTWLHFYTLPLQLDKANTMDEVDALVDQPANMFIINQSRWSIIEPVTMENKASLLQHLIWEEVILRKEGNVQAFKRGLDCLMLLQLMQTWPDVLKPLFVAQPTMKEVTAEAFLGLVASLKPHDKDQQRAYDYFHDFVFHLESKYIVTCVPVIPNC